MKLAVIIAPYDSGHHRSGFGLGPGAILAGGLIDRLERSGHDVSLVDIGEVGDAQGREISTGFAVCRAVADAVRGARREGRFPIVLAGNCLTAAGAVAGEDADSIIWCDQHGDLNTPETSAHGFLDGMALAVVLGICWRPMAATIPGFRPVRPDRCMLVDARDLDPDEKDLLARLPIRHVPCNQVFKSLQELMASGPRRLHVHLDLDVHDPSLLTANRYRAPRGPSPELLRKIVGEITRDAPVSGWTITAYDPMVDPTGKVPRAVGELLAGCLSTKANAGNEPARA